MPRKTNTAPATIGIDPGKNTLHLVGLDARGTIVLREKVSRNGVVARLANMPKCLIGIEAGMGTHYVTRQLLARPRREAGAAGLRQTLPANPQE